jgi:ankyrin repeat protein
MNPFAWLLASCLSVFALAATPACAATPSTDCLLHAAQENRTAAARRCLAAGGDALALDAQGRTPLAWAALYGDSRLADALLARKASLRWRAPGGATLLHEAVRWPVLEPADTPAAVATRPSLSGKRRIVDRLLRAGLDVDALDENGSTPLQLAVALPQQGPESAAIVRRLLAAGAQVQRANANGLTALDLARRRGAADLVALLESAASRQAAPRK